jgi:hypothetical protein
MLMATTALVLSIAGIMMFPCWRYSARWGYAPAMAAAFLLFGVVLASVGGKAKVTEVAAARHTTVLIAQAPGFFAELDARHP